MEKRSPRADSGLYEKPGDSDFGREVKRFALVRGLTSTTDLMRKIGATSEANVVRHLRHGRRRPQREIVKLYAGALTVPEAYLLALANHVDSYMVEDAGRTTESAFVALRPHLRPDRTDELWRRICAKWPDVATGVYMGVQRDRAERDCGLSEYPRSEVVVLLDVLHSLGFAIHEFAATPKATDLIGFVLLNTAIPAALIEQTRASVRDFYERLGVDVAPFDRELKEYNTDPIAWLRKPAMHSKENRK